MAALDVIVARGRRPVHLARGRAGPHGGNALATNGRLHDQALAFLGSLPDDTGDLARRGAGSVHELSARRRPVGDDVD